MPENIGYLNSPEELIKETVRLLKRKSIAYKVCSKQYCSFPNNVVVGTYYDKEKKKFITSKTNIRFEEEDTTTSTFPFSEEYIQDYTNQYGSWFKEMSVLYACEISNIMDEKLMKFLKENSHDLGTFQVISGEFNNNLQNVVSNILYIIKEQISTFDSLAKKSNDVFCIVPSRIGNLLSVADILDYKDSNDSQNYLGRLNNIDIFIDIESKYEDNAQEIYFGFKGDSFSASSCILSIYKRDLIKYHSQEGEIAEFYKFFERSKITVNPLDVYFKEKFNRSQYLGMFKLDVTNIINLVFIKV